MNLKKIVAVVAVLGVMLPAGAQDPIIQTRYTADPAPMVYNDTIFLYTTHDEDDAGLPQYMYA